MSNVVLHTQLEGMSQACRNAVPEVACTACAPTPPCTAAALAAPRFAAVFVDAPMTDAGEQGTAGAEVVVVAEEGCGGAAAAEEGGVEGPVCAEQQESVLGVQLKVEVLTALVSKMEHLVCRAEAAARALQVRLHPVRERGQGVRGRQRSTHVLPDGQQSSCSRERECVWPAVTEPGHAWQCMMCDMACMMCDSGSA